MISEMTIIDRFKGFADSAMPVLHITSEEAYVDALHFLETLLEKVGEDDVCPEQYLITLLNHAIRDYENSDKDVLDFMREADGVEGDVAVLKTIIEQHRLTLDSFPEIGHKSLISKILSGERQLTKNHIKSLCERFSLDPRLFF